MSNDYPQYPQYPGGPEQGGALQAAPERPASISTAVKLMWAGAAVSLLSVLVSLPGLGGLKEEIEESVRETDPEASQATIDAAYAVGVGFVIVMGLVGVALWAWMAWKNGQGRSWARIVATVLGVLNVLFFLINLGQPGTTTLGIVFALVTVLIGVAVLVLLWKKESTAYYEAVSRSRQLR